MKTTAEEAIGEDGFHEIQLSGKQLVFLCMATTVVSVLIFLCGVLVGRGVRVEKGDTVAAAAVEGPTASDRNAPVAPAANQGAGGAAGGTTYYGRLDAKGDAPETLKDVPDPAPGPAAASDTRVARAEIPPASAAAAAPPAAPAASSAPRAGGFVVQVASVTDRRDGEAMVRRLAAKGYPAFLLDPVAGAPNVTYRVRIGTYPDKREAERIAKRLEKEEQFKPWITR